MKESCIFCDRKNFEERLIHENKNFYVIASLGQITDGGYALLVPKEHIPCMGALAQQHISETQELSKKICRALLLEYNHDAYPVMFEHGIVGQTIKHAHLHFLPAAIDLTEKIRKDFPIAEIDELPRDSLIQDAYRKYQEPYLYWTTPDNRIMVCWNPSAPTQYLRTIAAEIIGRPERANWRNINGNHDSKLWSETVLQIKKYFV